MDKVSLFKDSVCIGRWCYSKPNLDANEEQEIILIHQYSVGPLEWWKWGIDAQGKYFKQYKWCENDFYEDESFREEISKSELLSKVQFMQSFYKENNVPQYVKLYKKVERFLRKRD